MICLILVFFFHIRRALAGKSFLFLTYSHLGFVLVNSDQILVLVFYRSRDRDDRVLSDGFTASLLVVAEMWPKIFSVCWKPF